MHDTNNYIVPFTDVKIGIGVKKKEQEKLRRDCAKRNKENVAQLAAHATEASGIIATGVRLRDLEFSMKKMSMGHASSDYHGIDYVHLTNAIWMGCGWPAIFLIIFFQMRRIDFATMNDTCCRSGILKNKANELVKRDNGRFYEEDTHWRSIIKKIEDEIIDLMMPFSVENINAVHDDESTWRATRALAANLQQSLIELLQDLFQREGAHDWQSPWTSPMMKHSFYICWPKNVPKIFGAIDEVMTRQVIYPNMKENDRSCELFKMQQLWDEEFKKWLTLYQSKFGYHNCVMETPEQECCGLHGNTRCMDFLKGIEAEFLSEVDNFIVAHSGPINSPGIFNHALTYNVLHAFQTAGPDYEPVEYTGLVEARVRDPDSTMDES